jgi:phage FluMu gp28-like protein
LPSITNPLRGGQKKCRLVTTPNGVGNKAHELWLRNYAGSGAQRGVPNRCGSSRGDEAQVSNQPKPPHVGSYKKLQRAGPETGAPAGGVVWSCHRVDIHEAVAGGLDLNIEELRSSLDDAEGWAQEFELNFLDQATVLLPYEVIVPCENPLATEVAPAEFWLGSPNVNAPLFLGIDFGRRKDLTVCWALELVSGQFRMTREVFTMAQSSTPAQLEALRPRLQRAQAVCFDHTGAGTGLGDLLAAEFGEFNPAAHQFGKIELCTFTNPLKVDIFSKLRMAFDQKTLGIPVSRVIREDLHSVSRVALAGGGVTYRAPHSDDGHADRCTALALAVRAAARLGRPGKIVVFENSRSARVWAARRDRSILG